MNFQPSGKAIKVIGLIQIMIVLMGVLICATEVRIWKRIYTYDLFQEEIPPPGLFVFWAYYGFLLFLIPLVWGGTSSYLYHFSGTSDRIQIPVYYSGYIITLLLFVWVIYSVIFPWGSGPCLH